MKVLKRKYSTMYYSIKYRVHPNIAFGLIYCIMFYAGKKIAIHENGVECASKECS